MDVPSPVVPDAGASLTSPASLAARAASEESYLLLFDNVAELVYIQDLDGRFLNVNEAVVRAYGYAREELIGQTPEMLGAPGRVDLADVMRRFALAVAGEPQRFDWWGLRKDGSTFPKDVTIQRSTYLGQDVVIAVARDMSERVEAEAALRRSEEHFRRLIEHASDLITILDAEGVVRYESPAITGILGYAPDELVGRNAFTYVAPEDVEAVLAAFQQAVEHPGTSVRVEFRFRHRDGSWRHLESVGTTLAPGSADEGVVVNSRDVTARRQADLALRESEAFKHAVVTSALDAIIAIDGEGRIVAFNPAAERILGHRADEVIGQPMAELIIPPRFRARHDAGMARYLATREPRVIGQRLEVAALRADGSEFPAELALYTAKVEGGREIFTAFLHDITHRKEAEESLRRYAADLEQARGEAERAREQASDYAWSLERSLERLQAAQNTLVQQEKMASLGRLTAGVAHELRNPLNFITNFSQLNIELTADIRAALVGGDAARAVEGLADVEQNARRVNEHSHRAAAIVDGMMEHARGGADAPSGQRRAVQLHAVLDAALTVIPATVALVRDYGADVSTVQADPEELARVFRGLLTNALDACAERGAGDAAFAPVLTLRTRLDGEMALIVLTDNGSGIPADVKDRVFEPFFTTKPTGSGHPGLGLSLTHEIVVKGYGGRIDVESAEGIGTTFTLALPVSPAAPAV